MNTFDFILPASRNGMSAERVTPSAPPAAKKSAEPFDSLMHRALAKPASPPNEYNSPIKKTARETRPSPAAKSEPGTPRKAKAAARPDASADNPATSTASTDTAASVPTVKEETAGKQDSNPAASATAANDATTTADPTALAMQTLPASANGLPLVQTPSTAKSSSTTGSQNAGNAAAAISAIGGGTTASAAVVVDKNPEPGLKEPAGKGKEIPVSKSDPAKNSGSSDGAIPVQALLGEAEKVKETPANIAASAIDKAQPPGPDATGTSSAKHSLTMKNAESAKPVAGMPEPNLPGVTVISALQSAAHPKPAARTAARVESADAPATANVASADRAPSTSETASNSSISASSQTELRLRALDRTHDILALQGLRLKETNAGSLHVVIKPGAGVQMSLQLKQTADGIEARAVLQQGDFKQLNQHWAELQQRLEERGIKLAPLGQDSFTMNNGGENFQRPSRQSAEQHSLSAGAFAEFASAGAGTARPVPTAAVASRGWESWA